MVNPKRFSKGLSRRLKLSGSLRRAVQNRKPHRDHFEQPVKPGEGIANNKNAGLLLQSHLIKWDHTPSGADRLFSVSTMSDPPLSPELKAMQAADGEKIYNLYKKNPEHAKQFMRDLALQTYRLLDDKTLATFRDTIHPQQQIQDFKAELAISYIFSNGAVFADKIADQLHVEKHPQNLKEMAAHTHLYAQILHDIKNELIATPKQHAKKASKQHKRTAKQSQEPEKKERKGRTAISTARATKKSTSNVVEKGKQFNGSNKPARKATVKPAVRTSHVAKIAKKFAAEESVAHAGIFKPKKSASAHKTGSENISDHRKRSR